jgi:peptidoglycan hydrolase-like protein with peptidoglycan-binding domain
MASVAVTVTIAATGCHQSSTAGSTTSPTTATTTATGQATSSGAATATANGATANGATANGATANGAPSNGAAITTTTRPAPATPVAPTTTTPAVAGPLQVGSSGPAVVQLQQSLSALGYWLGAADGRFGTTTQQAVFALQKAAAVGRSGVVDAATTAALAAGTKPTPRTTSGHVIEVDLAHQLLLIVTNGHLDGILNTSTGGGYVYYDQGARNVAITPTGHFTTYREIDALHMSSLGLLFRPKYFTGGFAIHGDTYVPARPVSHGCVRVTNQAIDWIWASGSDPIGTPVWVY